MNSNSIIKSVETPACPLCNQLGVKLHSQLQDRLFGAQGKWNISRCTDDKCGLIWLSTRPLEDEIYKAYATYYTHTISGRNKSLTSHLMSAILSFIINGVTHLSGLVQERKNVNQMHLNSVSPGRLLEVGCGDGAFLNEMKKQGWNVEGVDFDVHAAQVARDSFNIDVKVGKLEDIAYPDCSFDAVTLRHVIEHVFDPKGTMTEISRILKPGGLVILLTPNANSLGHEYFGMNWRGLEPPRHIHIFTPNTLSSIANHAGLDVIHSYSTAVNAWVTLSSSMQLLSNRDDSIIPIPKPSIRTILHALLMHFREARLNKIKLNVGEECVLVARKGL